MLGAFQPFIPRDLTRPSPVEGTICSCLAEDPCIWHHQCSELGSGASRESTTAFWPPLIHLSTYGGELQA
jgi:hypothetical protein